MSKTIRVSESVCAGHPDKLADRISDSILDAALSQDKSARVAVETLVANNNITLAGEITTSAKLDFEAIVRGVVAEQGYTVPEWGFSHESSITNLLHHQSPEIAMGVDDFGAGDQGLMYGYATDETEHRMPLPLALSHAIVRGIDEARQSGNVALLRPDGKAQVVIGYEDGVPKNVQHVTAAVAHDEEYSSQQVRQAVIEAVLEPVLRSFGLALPKEDNIVVNGTGLWHIPGPYSDSGLTGRKIVVDTYGGAAKVGGGAFSGKDPSKVDRSGAYAARYIANNLVAHGLARRAEVCLAYYIGAKQPIVKTVETFGTAKVSQSKIDAFVSDIIDSSVRGIIETLDLRRPQYANTSAYGHFGRPEFTWERIAK